MTLTLVTTSADPGRTRARPAPRQGSAPLRLTRRGRCVLATPLVGAVLAASLFVGGIGRAGTQVEPVAVSWVAVAPGDTLWGIAQRAAPGQDPRDLIVRIRSLNNLSDSGLHPGQRLLVPIR